MLLFWWYNQILQSNKFSFIYLSTIGWLNSGKWRKKTTQERAGFAFCQRIRGLIFRNDRQIRLMEFYAKLCIPISFYRTPLIKMRSYTVRYIGEYILLPQQLRSTIMLSSELRCKIFNIVGFRRECTWLFFLLF